MQQDVFFDGFCLDLYTTSSVWLESTCRSVNVKKGDGGAACHSSSKGQRAWLKSRLPDPCLMWMCETYFYLCVCVSFPPLWFIFEHHCRSWGCVTSTTSQWTSLGNWALTVCARVCVCPYICRQVVMFVHKVEYRKVLSSDAHIYIVSSFSIWKLLSPHSDYSWLQIVRVLSGFSCSVRGVEHDVRWSVRGELTMTDSSCHQLPHREGTSISELRPTNTLVNSLKFTQCTQARRREVRCMQTTAPDRDFCAFANKIVYRILY